MTILALRTDKPAAELAVYEDGELLKQDSWHADRELSTQLNKRINDLLSSAGKKIDDLEGIVCYEGPGSFTGLRIGLSVGNALAYGLRIPIAAKSGKDWLKQGASAIAGGKTDRIVLPKYDSPAGVSEPRK